MVDRISRMESATRENRRLLRSFGGRTLPAELTGWFTSPVCDWNLASGSTRNDRKLLKSLGERSFPEVLTNWFNNPVCDWNLALCLLNYDEIKARS